MDLETARAGTRMRSDYREPGRRGSVGTIQKLYGTPNYRAFEVLFPDGQTALFWDHQLEEVEGSASHRPKRWWAFW